MSNRRKPKGTPPDPDKRRAEAQVLIDKILHGTPEGRVDPAVSENLRKHLAAHPGQPDRALLAHFQDQIPGFDGVFPEDLK
jgi:hypothetical protein